MNIVLLNWETREIDKHVSRLGNFFEYPNVNLITTTDKDMINIFNSCNLDHYVLLIKDSSIIQLDKEKFFNYIDKAIEISEKNKISLTYLCSWDEKCHEQKDLYVFEDGIRIRTSEGNRSFQSMMLSPFLVKKILRKLNRYTKETFESLLFKILAKRQIKSALFVPNLIHFDPELSTNKFMFNRTNMCYASKNDNQDESIYIWLVVCIFLFVFSVCAVFLI